MSERVCVLLVICSIAGGLATLTRGNETSATSDPKSRTRSSAEPGDSHNNLPTTKSEQTPSTTPPGSVRKAPSQFIVALDIGHTRSRGGAISARGIFEYEFNRRLVGELFTDIQRLGFTRSFVINPQGNDISLGRRASEANAQGADLFLAIHHDSVKDRFLKTWEVNGTAQKYCDDFQGYSIFVSKKNSKSADSLTFASALGRVLLQAGFTPTLHHMAQENRPIIDGEKGIYSFDDLIVLKTAKMPAVLLECGVIVNRNEEEKLNSPAYRKRLEEAIGRAIQEFASR